MPAGYEAQSPLNCCFRFNVGKNQFQGSVKRVLGFLQRPLLDRLSSSYWRAHFELAIEICNESQTIIPPFAEDFLKMI